MIKTTLAAAVLCIASTAQAQTFETGDGNATFTALPSSVSVTNGTASMLWQWTDTRDGATARARYAVTGCRKGPRNIVEQLATGAFTGPVQEWALEGRQVFDAVARATCATAGL